MNKINRREAFKVGAAGMALVASPFAIAQGSVSPKVIQKKTVHKYPKVRPKKKRFSDFPISEQYKEFPGPVEYACIWVPKMPNKSYLAFWIEMYAHPSFAYDKSATVEIERASKQIKVRWSNWNPDTAYTYEVANRSLYEGWQKYSTFWHNGEYCGGGQSQHNEHRISLVFDNRTFPATVIKPILTTGYPTRIFASVSVFTYAEVLCRYNEIKGYANVMRAKLS